MKSQLCIVMLLAATAGCRAASSPADVPKAVFLSPGARELRVNPGAAPGQMDIGYMAEEKFPAPVIREGIAPYTSEHGQP